MRNIILIVAIFFTLNVSAQENLKVTYIHQFLIENDASDEDQKDPEFVAAMRAAREEIHTYHLLIDGNEANFIKLEKIDNSPPSGMKISFSKSGRGIYYKNVEEGYYMRDVENFNEKNIIRDSLTRFHWQIERAKDKILNYEVRKAVAQQDSITTITAWYTPQISLKHGPDEYWGLPGLILKIEVDKNLPKNPQHFYFTATDIQLTKSKATITKPTEGEIMTNAEFEKRQEEKWEKMREMYESGVDTSD